MKNATSYLLGRGAMVWYNKLLSNWSPPAFYNSFHHDFYYRIFYTYVGNGIPALCIVRVFENTSIRGVVFCDRTP